MSELALFLMLLNPTYTEDIKPLFHDRCSKCHDSMGDKNWQVYENAYKYRVSIRNKIITKEMPEGEDMPGNERDLIVEWIDSGAKK